MLISLADASVLVIFNTKSFLVFHFFIPLTQKEEPHSVDHPLYLPLEELITEAWKSLSLPLRVCRGKGDGGRGIDEC